MPATFTINPLTPLWTSKTDGDKITGTCVWQVGASEPVTPYQAERAGTPITNVGTTMPGTSSGVPCVSREARAADQTRMLYQVTCEFDSTREIAENPLDEPADISYDPEEFEESFFKDESDTPKYAVTTADEPFGELPKRDSGRLIINIEKNVAHTKTYNDYAAFLKPKLNNANVTIDGMTYAAGTLKTTPVRLSKIQERNGYQYRVLSIRLKANPDGWDQTYESRGFTEKIVVGSETIYQPILDENGERVQTPYPLDEDGAKNLFPNLPGADITLKPYVRVAFTDIPTT